jgi:long-chain acyl-CoA synthetase
MNPDRLEAIALLTAEGQDYEVIDGEVWGRPCRMFKNAPLTLRDLYESARSDATFLVYKDERYSFDDTQCEVARIARILIQDYGVTKGDRVAISMRNYPEGVMTFNAVTSIGAIAVALNSLWQTEEIEFGLKDCGAKVLFADQERIDRLEPVLGELELAVIAVRPANRARSKVQRFWALTGTVVGH